MLPFLKFFHGKNTLTTQNHLTYSLLAAHIFRALKIHMFIMNLREETLVFYFAKQTFPSAFLLIFFPQQDTSFHSSKPILDMLTRTRILVLSYRAEPQGILG